MIEQVPAITPGFESITHFKGQWYVVHTRSRFEKALAKDLLDLGICYYLPQRLKVYISSGKKRQSMLPIFTSYVFFCSEKTEDKQKVFKTNRAASILKVANQDRFVDELASIEKVLGNDIALEMVEKIPKGKLCRVTTGSLSGIEGIVVECNSQKAKIFLEVNVLGKGALMEISSSMVEIVR